ncbi:MAG: hypothetical protein KDB07_05835 [Planctomycetes bacterium]|nr:hypothetical protein [Planctomycetota bacterium]
MSQTRSVLLAVQDKALANEIESALAEAPIESFGRLSEPPLNAEDLLRYGPKAVILDVISFSALGLDEQHTLRQCGIEILVPYDEEALEKIPQEEIKAITDFISLPIDAKALGEQAHRAEGIFNLRLSKKGSGRMRKVAGEKPDTEKRTRKLTRRLSDLERLKSNLITVISHEFKTPLHLAAGYINLLEDESIGELNEEQRAAVDTIKRQLTRLADKLSDIERIAHLEMGLPEDLTEKVDLSMLLKREIEGFSKGLARKKIELRTVFEPNTPVVLGCQDFITDVFRRIIDNAIHYTSEGGNITVRASASKGEDEEQGVLVEVQDTGRGIPPSMVPHVFDRFGEFRDIEHHSSRRSGLGLGLAICRHLVELHNGTIACTSEVGKGSVFSVWLPVEP